MPEQKVLKQLLGERLSDIFNNVICLFLVFTWFPKI